MDLVAEMRTSGDYKRGAAAPVWLRGGAALNGARGGGGRGGAAAFPEDELGDSHISDLGELQVRHCCCCCCCW